MSAKIRFAQLASLACLQALLKNDQEPEDESRLYHEPKLPLTGMLYLWTFTTPDRVDLPTLSDRWAKLMRHFRGRGSLGVKWMRVYEPHETHGYHVHCVAVQRYDVRKIRTLAQKYGFGRLNVTMLPASKAGYVAKYLSKHKRKAGEKAVRMWACNGFKGISVSRVRIENSWLRWAIAHTVGFKDCKNWSLHYITTQAMLKVCEQNRINGSRALPMNANQEKIAVALLNKGAMVRQVEYRKHDVKEVRKYIDGKASLSEKSYVSQHFCESDGKPFLVEEKLPESYKPGDKLVPPMSKGQTAILEVTKVRDYKGTVTAEGIFHAVT